MDRKSRCWKATKGPGRGFDGAGVGVVTFNVVTGRAIYLDPIRPFRLVARTLFVNQTEQLIGKDSVLILQNLVLIQSGTPVPQF